MYPTIWQSDNGTVACNQHLGAYATAALEEKPTRKTITTPITRWVKMSDTEFNDWMRFLAMNGHNEACETCRRKRDMKVTK